MSKEVCSPSVMNWPRPPKRSPPMIEATVTRPIVVTAATRTPAMMSGTASGSCTRQKRLALL